MTVTYSDKSFLALLFRWRGSLWKAVWQELLIFVSAYMALNLSYRYGMTHEQAEYFHRLVKFCSHWSQHMPIQFLLGFYVSYIVSRCRDRPGSGTDERRRIIRRTLARYLNLHSVLVWREISIKVKKRFPTDDHLLQSGLMTNDEYDIYKNTTSIHGRWFVPVSWITSLLNECHQEQILSDIALQQLVNDLYAIRGSMGMLTVYDWINAPLVYTHVATLVTYGYFLLCLIGRQTLRLKDGQPLDIPGNEVDTHVPLVTLLEFLFYIGWLKVAERYRVPFGEDDDDFDMNYILDRNIHVSSMLVDELVSQKVQLVKDKSWGSLYPKLPHTKASYAVRDRVPNWRLKNVEIASDEAEILKHTLDEHETTFRDDSYHDLSRLQHVSIVRAKHAEPENVDLEYTHELLGGTCPRC